MPQLVVSERKYLESLVHVIGQIANPSPRLASVADIASIRVESQPGDWNGPMRTLQDHEREFEPLVDRFVRA